MNKWGWLLAIVISGQVDLRGTIVAGDNVDFQNVAIPANCATEVQSAWTASDMPFDLFEVAASSQTEGGFCRPDTLIESSERERLAS